MTTAYADYTYYTGTYLGNLIASADFNRLALRASAQIDKLTFNRAAAETDLNNINSIKMATCAVAEEVQKIEQDGGNDAIQSESIGNNSITYAAGATRTRTTTQRYEAVAADYLGQTGLMFRGFAADEYGDEPSDE